jgi:CubicO group peptidase (beta-lactamase class C family)
MQKRRSSILAIVVTLLIVSFGLATVELQGQTASSSRTKQDDGFWKSAKPQDVGIDITALAAHESLCKRTGADACLVIRHDQIVQEWYSPRYSTPMYPMSSTKSVAGLLVGMLVDDRRIASPETHVCVFIATWCDVARAPVTVRHLLTMTSGLPMMPDSSVGFVREKNAYVMRLMPTSRPGTTWAYSNEGVQLLSPILDRAAGEPIQDYARRRLFEPLGMMETRLHVYPENAWLYADMETTARDFARLGVLMLHHGCWRGKQIVSQDWITQSTRGSQPLNSRYGLLWWIDPEIKGYAAHGHLDTDLHVIPDLDLVVVRMQSKRAQGAAEGEYEKEALALLRRLVLPSL